ncbi:Gfo/Idh/MocA family oxidoreductase [Sphingomonas oligophenolica]|uniref:Gfo/Idh/MocA family oxidoreductase n=1 Tax=Sphingomonas oligophenolica TaxID=301154 RepID=A0ABU9Y969_9SPHN
MSADGPLKTCLVGLGWWGRQLCGEADGTDVLEITSSVDPSAESAAFARARNIPHFATLGEALNGDTAIDAVMIATPHSLHEEQCLLALAHGKPVFCEKPLTLTAAGAQRIVDAAADKALVLGIGHERRFEAGFEALAGLIAAGSLGRVIFIDANVSHNLMLRAKPGDWRLSGHEAPAGLWTGTGIHLSDLIIASCGAPEGVRLELLSTSDNFSGQELVRVDLKMASGVHATVTALACTPYYGRYTVFGDLGWAELVTLANVDGGQDAILTVSQANGVREERRIAPSPAIRTNLELWARAALGRGSYPIKPDQMVLNTAVLEAIARAGGRAAPYASIPTG